MKILAWALACSLCLLVSAEIFLRLSGFGSFPIYDLDTRLKYIPAANQHGAFLDRNKWVFNNRHMGNADDWTSGKSPNILLLGNSIVFGGNPFNQGDKLGPQLRRALGGRYAVWSAAAGGWTDINEMNYLDENRDVLKNSDVVVIEYMAGGLSTAAQWPGEYVFPDHRPMLLTEFVFRKYILPRLFGKKVLNESGALPPVGPTDPAQKARFVVMVSKIAQAHKVVIFLYPEKKYLSHIAKWQAAISGIVGVCRSLNIACVDIASEKTWNAALYRSDETHPTIEGNKVLAAILGSAVTSVSKPPETIIAAP